MCVVRGWLILRIHGARSRMCLRIVEPFTLKRLGCRRRQTNHVDQSASVMTPVTVVAQAFLIFTLISSTVLAQPFPEISPPEAKPDINADVLTPLTPPLSPPIRIPPIAPSDPPAQSAKIPIDLKSIVVRGVSAYPKGTLKSIYADLIGKEITLEEIYEIATAIETKYRKDGYFLTRVIVPEQTIHAGSVELLVIEGYVSEIEYQEDVGNVRYRVQEFFKPVLVDRPLRLQTLERALLLAKDIPGLDAIGVLRPSKDHGAAKLAVSLQRKPFDVVALVDNHGSDLTGTWQAASSVSANAHSRFGEQLTIVGILSDVFGDLEDNERVVQLTGSTLVGGDGLSVRGVASYGRSEPGGSVDVFDFESDSIFVGISTAYPILRSRNRNLLGEVGFDYIDADTDVFGNQRFSKDRLRVLYVEMSGDVKDRWLGASAYQVSLRQGLPIFGATEDDDIFRSRGDASGVFTSVNATVSRLQRLGKRFTLLMILGGQYAFDNLLANEEFEAGGTRFGRGYDSGELTGDHGVGLTAELQYTARPAYRFLDRYQAVAFLDHGHVWERKADTSDTLVSIGVGLRAWPIQPLSLELQLAKPLTRDSQRSDGERDVQALFRSVLRF